MEETARAIGHRLWVLTAMTSLMLFLIAGLTVMAQPQRASAAPLADPVSVSTQDATASALDHRRCYKQVYRWKHKWHKKWVCKHHYHKHHKKNYHHKKDYHHKNNWRYNNYDHHGGYHR